MKNKNILMLDLEGVLVLTADSDVKRNYADEFMKECTMLFDKIYLNTAVPEEHARYAMKEKFNVSEIGYWRWNYYKTEGYEKLVKNSTVFHVEDGVEYVEREEMHRLGVHYVEVNPNWDEDEGELRKAMEKIKGILGK